MVGVRLAFRRRGPFLIGLLYPSAQGQQHPQASTSMLAELKTPVVVHKATVLPLSDVECAVLDKMWLALVKRKTVWRGRVQARSCGRQRGLASPEHATPWTRARSRTWSGS
jgi:hypothetical protein